MTWLKTLARELLGLFVDDASFAATIVVWLLVIWLVPPLVAMPSSWSVFLLFAGLVVILVESAMRRARR